MPEESKNILNFQNFYKTDRHRRALRGRPQRVLLEAPRGKKLVRQLQVLRGCEVEREIDAREIDEYEGMQD